MSFNAFASVNYPVLAYLRQGKIIRSGSVAVARRSCRSEVAASMGTAPWVPAPQLTSASQARWPPLLHSR